MFIRKISKVTKGIVYIHSQAKVFGISCRNALIKVAVIIAKPNDFIFFLIKTKDSYIKDNPNGALS